MRPRTGCRAAVLCHPLLAVKSSSVRTQPRDDAPAARRGLSDTWLTLLSEHMVNSLLVEPLEQVPHEPGTCVSGEALSGRRRIHSRS